MASTEQSVRDILVREGHPLQASYHGEVVPRLAPGATDADVLAAATALLNTRRFTAQRSPVRMAFPALSTRRADGRIEWSLRASHPLAGSGLPLNGVLTIDMPCQDRAQDLLDAMAEANDLSVGLAETSEILRLELDHVSGRARDAVAKLHAFIGDDLANGIRDIGAYVASLESQLHGRVIYLYPERTGGAEGYKPGRHVRELLKTIRHNARLAMRTARPGLPAAPRMATEARR